MLNTAVEGGALRANPAHSMRLPIAAKGATRFLRPEQVAALAEAITPGMFGTLIRFAAYTGAARR